MWSPEYLERLAATYWRFITRFTLGLLRVRHTHHTREVVLLGGPFVLLRFRKPEYHIEPGAGVVTWPIDRGLLVAPSGRGRGYLRLSVRRAPNDDGRSDDVTATISSEVVNFYPMLANWGWFSRIGQLIYNETQLRIHVIVTHAFLRSLANLDLVESKVGALAPPEGEAPPVSRAARR
jgi:hypothetical protein